MNIESLQKELKAINGELAIVQRRIDTLTKFKDRGLTIMGRSLSTDLKVQRDQVRTRNSALRKSINDRFKLQRKQATVADKIKNLKERKK